MARGTNCSNFTMILSFISQNRINFKTRRNSGFFSQLPEIRVSKFCPELETQGKTAEAKKEDIALDNYFNRATSEYEEKSLEEPHHSDIETL